MYMKNILIIELFLAYNLLNILLLELTCCLVTALSCNHIINKLVLHRLSPSAMFFHHVSAFSFMCVLTDRLAILHRDLFACFFVCGRAMVFKIFLALFFVPGFPFWMAFIFKDVCFFLPYILFRFLII